jgi:signal transduction histidine kinase
MLARTFDEMTQSVEQRTRELETSQKELARWNLDLEEKVRQRTHELEEANEVRTHLLQKLILAQEDERRRIARELHDNASQSLAAVVINLNNIVDDLPDEHIGAKEKLNMLKEQTIQTLHGIRNLALELRPSVLDDLGLTSAIEWYARDYLSKRGLDVKIEISSQRKLPSYTETTLFRIIQEALTNIVKHAEANRVIVQLNVTEFQAVVQVADNGKGFDVDKVLSTDGLRQNLGIQGMVERATLLNGTFTIESKPGKGTSICVTVRLPAAGGVNG